MDSVSDLENIKVKLLYFIENLIYLRSDIFIFNSNLLASKAGLLNSDKGLRCQQDRKVQLYYTYQSLYIGSLRLDCPSSDTDTAF